VPAPDERIVAGEADPRRTKCKAEWVEQDALLPYIKASHEFSPDHGGDTPRPRSQAAAPRAQLRRLSSLTTRQCGSG
jgi:hypothetical protein